MLIAGRAHFEPDVSRPPFVRSWNADNPLPTRVIRSLGAFRSQTLVTKPPPWVSTAAAGCAFNFCDHIRRLCADVAACCAGFRHIDVSRLLFTVTQARSHRLHGLQARVTPLRFRGGSLVRHRSGTQYRVQRYFVGNEEMLYVVGFCLPRFLDQDFDDKLITLFHELYHISPDFDGDLRRHRGRYSVHSHSKRNYDRHMADLARAYLGNGANTALGDFLRLNFSQLEQCHGKVVGVVVPRPKLIPLPAKRAGAVVAPSDQSG